MSENTYTLLSAIQIEQENLTKMVANKRERLRNQDVYGKSCELDRLIVKYMRMLLAMPGGNLVED